MRFHFTLRQQGQLEQLVLSRSHLCTVQTCQLKLACQDSAEARLGNTEGLLSPEHREIVTTWWLAVRGRANTPNWDIAATASIGGTQGLVLVEAKAHAAELKGGGHGIRNRENLRRIRGALEEANTALRSLNPAWSLSCDSHYQLCNRFAWSWKLASLGIPVVLVYLGFLNG